jgi:hypothetical protein
MEQKVANIPNRKAIEAATELNLQFSREKTKRKQRGTVLTEAMVTDHEQRFEELKRNHPDLPAELVRKMARYVGKLRKELKS